MARPIRANPGQSDINGDGEVDWVAEVNDFLGSTCGLQHVTRSMAQGEVVFSTSCVLQKSLLVNFVSAQNPGAKFWGIEDITFFDVDEDGDLDVLLNLFVDEDLLPCWAENTGFEAAPPRLADINRDGNVDAADLSLLLADWG
jgi:hypothetical protein